MRKIELWLEDNLDSIYHNMKYSDQDYLLHQDASPLSPRSSPSLIRKKKSIRFGQNKEQKEKMQLKLNLMSLA